MVGEGGCWAMASDLGLEILGLTVCKEVVREEGGHTEIFLCRDLGSQKFVLM